MIREQCQIKIPAALLIGQVVWMRQYPFQMYTHRAGAYIATRLESFTVRPEWAKVYLTVMQSGQPSGTFNSGETINLEATEYEPREFFFVNESTDTEAFITMAFRSWQYGEA